MGKLQKIYDWFDKWTTPRWLKNLLGQVQEILISILTEIGKDYLDQLETKIIETAREGNFSNKEKFEEVFRFARSIGIEIKDNLLNTLINSLVSRLKKIGVI